MALRELPVDCPTHSNQEFNFERQNCPWIAGGEIPLRPIEFKLLRHLLEKAGNVISGDELIAAASPQNAGVSARWSTST